MIVNVTSSEWTSHTPARSPSIIQNKTATSIAIVQSATAPSEIDFGVEDYLTLRYLESVVVTDISTPVQIRSLGVPAAVFVG